MKLSDILKEVETTSIEGPVDRVIHALRYDSRRVEANDVFFAWKGAKTDGHSYIAEVCDKGAAAVVLENPHFMGGHGPTFIEVKSARRTMADMSANFFGHPDRALKMVGVTGTNGKTTTAFVLKHLLTEPKAPVGLIGTVRYEIGERILPASRTTPESLDLHGLLAQMKAAGCLAAVMEVSSHALEQGRVAPIEFQVGIFTNLTQDHLDYHQTMENYFAAKVLLFANLDRAKNPGVAVINADDSYGKRLIELLRNRVRVIAYTLQGEAGSEIEARDIVSTAQGTTGALRIGDETFPFALPLIGSYNVANALAAAGAALALGIAPQVIVERLRDTPQVPGRLEKFVSADGVTAVVDYAHTDDAVRKALTVLRGITKGRLIAVLGCGGNRDAVKRPLMAAAAVECADYSIFTADNPRQESVESILDHMEAGVAGKYFQSQYERLPDRRQAIARALALAQPGDIVCVAGKGHETTQEIAGQFHPFDDRLVVQEFLQKEGRVMRRCTLEEVARLSGGRLIKGDPMLPVDRLHTDTRTLLTGDCFVALQGDRFDGHTFVAQVKNHGAVAALVSHRLNAADLPDDLGLVEVPNTLEALQRFAANYRQLLSVRTIGVTGSSGKTSTKEMIASVLRTRFKTKATDGNLNNHIGVPLTLIRLDEDDAYGVVEMGMNHPGELAPLVRMTAPEIGVISSIGPAHIEFFADQAAIAAEKAELIAALPPEGLAVLNGDDEWSRRIAGRTHARVVWVGDHPDSTWRAEDLQVATDSLSFLLKHNGSAAPVRLPVVNRVMVNNALLAAAVGDECGLTLEEIARGLEALQLPGARMQVLNAHGAWIINDAYNANPDSMKAALVALSEFPGANRRLAVLGSMGELGRHATELHYAVGEFAAQQDLAFLIAVGPHAEAYAKGAMAAGLGHNQIVAALDAEEATVALKPLLRESDAVLVKGSRFMGLDRLVAALTGTAEKGAH